MHARSTGTRDACDVSGWFGCPRLVWWVWLLVEVAVPSRDVAAKAVLISARVHDRIMELVARGDIEIADTTDIDRVAIRAADYAVGDLRRPRRSAVAERIGPIYTAAEVAAWLVAPGTTPLSTEAIRKRALKQQLVAFQADDRHWAFPAWQFDPIAGRLVVRDDVTALWQTLPHDTWRSAATLAAWMNSPLRSMEGVAPAAFAAAHGADHPTVAAAVSRLRAGAAA